MARSISEIESQIVSDVKSNIPELTSTSKRSIWGLWCYVYALCISTFEQLLDIFKSNTENTVANAIPLTAQWLQNKVFEFQYDATNPQVLQLINFVPQYPLINTSLRIVTRCSVKTDISNIVKIKVATGNTPAALSSLQISALQSYINTLGTAGIKYIVTSTNSDKIYIAADIYYQGVYSSVISANVIAAINNYFSSIPFDGAVKLSDLENAIRNTTGVNDCVLKNVSARADSTAFGSGTDLILNNQLIGRIWNTVSGYIVPETTTGNTLADTLNFIAE